MPPSWPLKTHGKAKTIVSRKSLTDFRRQQCPIGVQKGRLISQGKGIVENVRQAFPQEGFPSCEVKTSVTRFVPFTNDCLN